MAGLIRFGGLYGFLSYITRTVDTIAGMNPNIMPFVMMVIGIGACRYPPRRTTLGPCPGSRLSYYHGQFRCGTGSLTTHGAKPHHPLHKKYSWWVSSVQEPSHPPCRFASFAMRATPKTLLPQ
ncbi:MAG: hypothetical protein U1U88_001913 [Lawsonella clevelandensis]